MAVGRTLARGAGAFGLALGAVQLLAPRRFARAIGVPPDGTNAMILRAVGLREVGAASGLLVPRWPVAFQWLRVVGDAIDLALLGRALRGGSIRRDRVTAAIAAVAGVTALDVAAGVLVAREAPKQRDDGLGGRKPVRKSVTIGRPPEEVYAFWRDLGNLPRFMRHIEEVRETDGLSHWTVKAPAGTTVSWDAEITEDRPNERIAWRSVEGSTVANEGSVTFAAAPGDRGTQLDVELTYEPPAGPLGVIVAKLFGEEPEQQASEDLRRLKQILETGIVQESEAMTAGRTVRQRPAQPLELHAETGR